MSRRLGLLVVAAVLAIVAWPSACDAVASVAVATPAEASPVPAVVDVGAEIDRSTAAPAPTGVEVRVSHIASATALRGSLLLLIVLTAVGLLALRRPGALVIRRTELLLPPLAAGWGATAPPRAPPTS